MKKMTLKKWEKSAADKRADKAGKHGKEGSKKDKMMDKKAVARMNKKRRFICGDQSAEYVAVARDRLRMPFERRHVVQNDRVDDLPLFAGIEAR